MEERYMDFIDLYNLLIKDNKNCTLVRIITSYYYTDMIKGFKTINRGPRIFYGLINNMAISVLIDRGYDLKYHDGMIDVNLLRYGELIEEEPYESILPTGRMMNEAKRVFNICQVKLYYCDDTKWINDKYYRFTVCDGLPEMVKVTGKYIINHLTNGKIYNCIVPDYQDEIIKYKKCKNKRIACR